MTHLKQEEFKLMYSRPPAWRGQPREQNIYHKYTPWWVLTQLSSSMTELFHTFSTNEDNFLQDKTSWKEKSK